MLGNIIVQSIACAIIATPAYTIVSMILNVSFVPGAAALIIAAFAAWRQGYTPARLYLLGWGLYLVGVITSILSLVGIIEYSELRAIRLLWIGVAMETVIFSFALIERMNTIRRALAQEQQQRVLADKEREREHERTLEIERHNSELERTNEIVTRQAESIQQANVLLKQQNARLEEFNHEKNEMLAMVSHDLKNPLAALRGIAELLQAEGRDSTLWKSALLQMMATTDRMLALVKNLLDVNRLETEGINYTAIPVFVEAIINETVALYNKQATAKGIHILSDTSKTYTNENNVPIMALADEQALTQVLDNLVSNALKYSPYRASVFVSAFAYDAEKADISDLHKHNLKCYDMLLPQCMVISVKDQGPGISVKDQAQLFGKFRRLSAQPTGGEHSTGLGLSIVKKIVDGMNGRVWCESDFGYGATFFVVLPLA
jgi:signal transduction histidine kinase